MSSKRRAEKKKKREPDNPRGQLLTVSNSSGDVKTVYAADFRGSKWRGYAVIKT